LLLFVSAAYHNYISLVTIFLLLYRTSHHLNYLVASIVQVGKGRDVGLNQIATFEAKVASGNGEQALARDLYRLGQLLDFPRMLSFFFTSVGFYVTTMVSPIAPCLSISL
jgi:hypothetical protein